MSVKDSSDIIKKESELNQYNMLPIPTMNLQMRRLISILRVSLDYLCFYIFNKLSSSLVEFF